MFCVSRGVQLLAVLLDNLLRHLHSLPRSPPFLEDVVVSEKKMSRDRPSVGLSLGTALLVFQCEMVLFVDTMAYRGTN